MNQKGFIPILIIILLAAAAVLGGYLIYQNQSKPIPSPKPTLQPTTQPSPSQNPIVCVQIIQPAKNPQTGECKEFPTPCDIPEGWQKVSSCPSEGAFCGGIAGLPCPSGYKCVLDGNYPDAGGKCIKE